MKNPDKPAYPQLHSIDGNWVREPKEEYRGLAKREHLAMGNWSESELQREAQLIADEINHNSNFSESVNASDTVIRMKARVRLADALLRELENKTITNKADKIHRSLLADIDEEIKETIHRDFYSDCVDMDKLDRSDAEFDLHTIDMLQSAVLKIINKHID